jgi:transposase, IS5 family
MYRKQEKSPISPDNFEFPFEVKLLEDNRWVVLAKTLLAKHCLTILAT